MYGKERGPYVKAAQELLRHANSRATFDLYAQAGMQEKREAQCKLVRLLNNGWHWPGPNWTMSEICQSRSALK